MTVKKKYVKGAHISERKFRELVRLFWVDLNASQITNLVGLSRNTVNRYLNAIRVRLAEFCDSRSPFRGEVEVDESFFGARRVKGKRGRGAYGKNVVFGIFKRNGSVYTEIVPNCSKATLNSTMDANIVFQIIG